MPFGRSLGPNRTEESAAALDFPTPPCTPDLHAKLHATPRFRVTMIGSPPCTTGLPGH